MRLNDWQLAFERYLLGESAVAAAALGDSLIGGPSLDVETGLAIYHNAYRARLQETLRSDFPTVWHWMGDEEFDALTAAYLSECPSSHYSLRWLGAGFEAFVLRQLVPAQGEPLAELIRLEWAFTLAFDAPPGEPLTLEAMATLAAEAWPSLQLELVPSVQWLDGRFNSLAMWRAVKAEAEFPDSLELEQPQVCLVWRAGLVCQYRSLEPEEVHALGGMVNAGWSFAELCAELAVSLGEGAPLQAVSWLKQWVNEGLVSQRHGL
ncbi:putative DNA-binding domain-containing protein [Pseudomonas gingeri]|uniref:HvfC/BufC N-terminal domain-containing protein n=1 Tax=Pseudomonas gingeri TaxID=117681 RepID=UPI0015A2DC7C|nr:DNA-binding domain-containing protein [Pseudomonas gingeri]NWA27441.1 putative DNA-binding domain-containing protein [Pseudomonas gingeri]NWD69209.1 putative DNA-binding domain-containing protein [Pseudomonas gingeri]NWD76844.1 putative DNA-binding domain-containing protein [Pseudomonas gingeri]